MQALAGIKGYVTNLRACTHGTPITPEFVIGSCRQLFQIEKSSRMTTSDLQVRPVYHRKRDLIELTWPSCSPPSPSASGSSTR